MRLPAIMNPGADENAFLPERPSGFWNFLFFLIFPLEMLLFNSNLFWGK